jgi:hypothetical protein
VFPQSGGSVGKDSLQYCRIRQSWGAKKAAPVQAASLETRPPKSLLRLFGLLVSALGCLVGLAGMLAAVDNKGIGGVEIDISERGPLFSTASRLSQSCQAEVQLLRFG